VGILPLLSINPLLTLRAHAKEYPPWVSVVVCDVCKCRRSKGRRFAVRLRTSLRHPIPYPLCSWFSPHERGVSSRLAFDCIFSSFSCLRFVTGLPAQCHRAVGSMSSCCHPSRVAWRVRRGLRVSHSFAFADEGTRCASRPSASATGVSFLRLCCAAPAASMCAPWDRGRPARI